jgi:protocatechuate 3,4-dioxygenase, alpha subunit
MSGEGRFIPASSQTVGPYFRIGLQYLIDRGALQRGGGITIRGRVLDRDGAPVSDAMLELWSPACEKVPRSEGLPNGFVRVATDIYGAFEVDVPRPNPVPMSGGPSQAPHFLVLVFARGLLRHLITRVYLDDEHANASDPVLLSVSEERRGTLIAQRDEAGVFLWDVILQGSNETVFFSW